MTQTQATTTAHTTTPWSLEDHKRWNVTMVRKCQESVRYAERELALQKAKLAIWEAKMSA